MSIVDDFVENLVERNVITVKGSLVVELLDGGVRVKGALASTLRDQKKGKDLLRANVPVSADLKVGEIVIPVPQIP